MASWSRIISHQVEWTQYGLYQRGFRVFYLRQFNVKRCASLRSISGKKGTFAPRAACTKSPKCRHPRRDHVSSLWQFLTYAVCFSPYISDLNRMTLYPKQFSIKWDVPELERSNRSWECLKILSTPSYNEFYSVKIYPLNLFYLPFFIGTTKWLDVLYLTMVRLELLFKIKKSKKNIKLWLFDYRFFDIWKGSVIFIF